MKLPNLGSSVQQVVSQVASQVRSTVERGAEQLPAAKAQVRQHVADGFDTARHAASNVNLNPCAVAGELRTDAKSFRVGFGEALQHAPKLEAPHRAHRSRRIRRARRVRTHAARRHARAHRRRRHTALKLRAPSRMHRARRARRASLHVRRRRTHHAADARLNAVKSDVAQVGTKAQQGAQHVKDLLHFR